MKNLILIALTCLCFSCGKSVYYAYEYRDAINDHYSYCTLEVTRKKEIIYRASSDDYFVYPNNVHLFVCIYSDKDAAKVSKNYYGFGSAISELWTIKVNDVPNLKMPGNLLSLDNEVDSSVSYGIMENDTIVRSTDDFEYLKKGRGFKENGILWFPKYMVKVDRIDYNKFYKQIRHMNLKNPRKTKS